jgi:hypothetical protein
VAQNWQIKSLVKRKNSDILIYSKQKNLYKEIHIDDLSDNFTDLYEDIFDEFNVLEQPLKSYLNNSTFTLKERFRLLLKTFSISHTFLSYLLIFIFTVFVQRKSLKASAKYFAIYLLIFWSYQVLEQLIRHWAE